MLPTSSLGRASAAAANARPRASLASTSMRDKLVGGLPSRSVATFCAACLAWYFASALSSNTSKAILSAPKHSPKGTLAPFPYPVSLTMLQFVFVHVFCAASASSTLAGLLPGAAKPLASIQQPSWSRVREMAKLSVFNVAGHALSSLAISRVPVSTVHTIKALTPLFTVLSFRLLFSVVYPLRTYVALAPLTVGVMLACTGMAFNADDILGLSAALGSTFVFVAQNIYSKKLLSRPSGAGDEKLDKMSLLYYSSACSVVLMLPLFVYNDLPKLLGSSPGPTDPHHLQHLTDHVVDPSLAVDASVLSPAATVGAMGVIWLLMSNGVVHFAQSVLAFSVLGLVSPVTYSIASLFKRVFVICVAIAWFGQRVSRLQWLGITLTFIGLYLYNDAKTRSSNSASDSKIRRDERTTLPTTRGDLPALYVPAPLPRQHQAPISGLGIRSAGSHMSSRSVGVLGTDRRDHGAGNMPLFDPRASIPSPPESGRGSDDGLAHIGQQKRD